MSGGRPTGSKNQKGHRAGGARRGGAGRKSKEAQADGSARALAHFEARRGANAAGPAAAAEEEKKRREIEFQRKVLKELQASAHDQQMHDEECCDARDVCPDLVEIDDDTGVDGNGEEEVEDYETDDEGEGETKKRQNRVRSACMPPPNSPLQLLLKKTQDKQKTSPSSITQLAENGKMWVPPETDPLAMSVTGPDRYCTSDLWQFTWRPFKQFNKHVQLSNMGCIHGCDRGDLDVMLKLKEM